MDFKFNSDKAIAVLLYVCKQLENVDLHKAFKIMFYADQKHLVAYGRPISGDIYIAMKDGPVPSNTFDIVKTVRGDSIWVTDEYKKFFSIDGYMISCKMDPNLEDLSASDIECLDISIKENKGLTFQQLRKKSHGSAYKKADWANRLLIDEIAKEGGANDEMLKYINAIAENYSAFTK